LKQKVDIALPKFEIFRHNQEAALAAEREARYDLQRVSELTKNQSTIYHGLADAVAESLNAGGVELGKPPSFITWIADWETWIIAGVALLALTSLVVSITVGYKIRLLTAMVMIAKSQASATEIGQTAIRLNYFATTPITRQSQNVTSVIAVSIAPYSAIEIAILTMLSAVIFGIGIYVWRRYHQRNYFYFCIELGNEGTFERIQCIKLTGSENLYVFMATSFIKSITIKWGLRPKLLIVWPTFCVKHTTLNSI
jgi:hypothetical protein